MIRNLTNRIILIVVVVALAMWINLSQGIELFNPLNDELIFERDIQPRLGLDLQGGLQVLLEADIPADQTISADEMEVARQIVQQRTDALGVNENVITVAGDRRIVGEFPGLEDTESVLSTIQQTGLLEFVDTGDFAPEVGSILVTDYSPTGEVIEAAEGETVYHTIFTGVEIDSVSVGQGEFGEYYLSFVLKANGAQIFGDHTTANTNKFLAIVL